MVASNGLFRIFWPSDAPRGQTQGVLIGWRNSDSDVLVITILQHVEVGHSTFKKGSKVNCLHRREA
jgi:phosphatidylinositol N-acetylglucosaminyltransferase subunit Q